MAKEQDLYEETVSKWEEEMKRHDLSDEEDEDSASGKKKKKKKKKKTAKDRLKGLATVIGIAAIICFGAREFISYSDNAFIKKWRTIYIQTAMTSNSHQWLATFFLPRSVVNTVLADTQANYIAQQTMTTYWGDDDEFDKYDDLTGEEWFYAKYWELDNKAFKNYLKENPDLLANGYENIYFKDLNGDLGLFTTKGDAVLALDTANNYILLGLSGDGYEGKMILLKDPSQIKHVLSSKYLSAGEEIGTFGDTYDALFAINASSFLDVGGHGSGAEPRGSVLIDGVEYNYGLDYKWYVMDFDDHFSVLNYDASKVSDYRWGLQFMPALIVNGENAFEGDGDYGIQPRTCIGQAKDGTFMMLIIDGRQPGYSVGATVGQCRDIMSRYGAWQAGALDGGSSSVMYYDGDLVTSCSSATGRGRYCPDALIVLPADAVDGWTDEYSKFPF